jgi:D-proline reductase (dithiol) PrdB
VSLVARHLEANGIATMCMASALDIIQAGRPPRAAFVDYPLGHTAGKPFDPDDQLAVIRQGLIAFDTMRVPGQIHRLPNRWSADDAWKQQAGAATGEDTRRPRDETPQFQTEADRVAAVAAGALPR